MQLENHCFPNKASETAPTPASSTLLKETVCVPWVRDNQVQYGARSRLSRRNKKHSLDQGLLGWIGGVMAGPVSKEGRNTGVSLATGTK